LGPFLRAHELADLPEVAHGGAVYPLRGGRRRIRRRTAAAGGAEEAPDAALLGRGDREERAFVLLEPAGELGARDALPAGRRRDRRLRLLPLLLRVDGRLAESLERGLVLLLELGRARRESLEERVDGARLFLAPERDDRREPVRERRAVERVLAVLAR